jgi:mRNA-degrading endonuclease RelE of RelBE toxin-antitoxin system
MYKVKTTKKALKVLKSLDKQIARMNIAWIEKILKAKRPKSK